MRFDNLDGNNVFFFFINVSGEPLARREYACCWSSSSDCVPSLQNAYGHSLDKNGLDCHRCSGRGNMMDV